VQSRPSWPIYGEGERVGGQLRKYPKHFGWAGIRSPNRGETLNKGSNLKVQSGHVIRKQRQ